MLSLAQSTRSGPRALPVPSALCWILPAVALTQLAFPGAAQEPQAAAPELPWSRYGLFFGGYLARYDSSVRFGSASLGTGVEINLEDALDLDARTSSWRFGGFWRTSDNLRHTISLDYSKTKRSASKTLTEDITIGDTTFPAGTTLSSDTSLGIIRAAYGYSFVLDERLDLAARFGIYTMPMSFEFKGLSETEKTDFTAPLPTIGLKGDVAITPRFFLRQSIDFFYLKYGDFTGQLTDISIGLEYKAWKHWFFGLALNSFRVALQAEGKNYPELDLTGDVEYGQNGVMGFLRFEW
jgi:hypothetical protein